MEMLSKRNAEVLHALGSIELQLQKTNKTLEQLQKQKISLLDMLEELESLRVNQQLLQEPKSGKNEPASSTN